MQLGNEVVTYAFKHGPVCSQWPCHQDGGVTQLCASQHLDAVKQQPPCLRSARCGAVGKVLHSASRQRQVHARIERLPAPSPCPIDWWEPPDRLIVCSSSHHLQGVGSRLARHQCACGVQQPHHATAATQAVIEGRPHWIRRCTSAASPQAGAGAQEAPAEAVATQGAEPLRRQVDVHWTGAARDQQRPSPCHPDQRCRPQPHSPSPETMAPWALPPQFQGQVRRCCVCGENAQLAQPCIQRKAQ